MHITCLLWVCLSLLCVDHYPSSSMPQCNTVWCEEICHSRTASQALYSIPLSKWSLKSGNTCPSHWDVCFLCIVLSGFYGARFMEMASRDILNLLAVPADLWNLH